MSTSYDLDKLAGIAEDKQLIGENDEEENGLYRCRACEEGFESPFDLKAHYQWCHPDIERDWLIEKGDDIE